MPSADECGEGRERTEKGNLRQAQMSGEHTQGREKSDRKEPAHLG